MQPDVLIMVRGSGSSYENLDKCIHQPDRPTNEDMYEYWEVDLV